MNFGSAESILKTQRRESSNQPIAFHYWISYLYCMEVEATYICAYCLQVNAIVVDGTGGKHQTYVEDCQVCCRPNNLTIAIDDKMETAEIYAEIV